MCEKIKIVDKNCIEGWSDDSWYNLMIINHVVSKANDMLRIRGWISLNEVYLWLGLPLELNAQIVGWKFTDGRDQDYVWISAVGEDSNIKITFKNIVDLL